MKKFILLCSLLPAAAFGQSAQTITGRVAAILRNNVLAGAQGVYLKQVGGPVLAVQQERQVFDPVQTVAIMPVLYAFEGARVGAMTLDGPITRFTNAPTGCPNPGTPGGTEPLSTAIREMMWHNDNARMHQINVAFGRAAVDKFSLSLGYPVMTQPQIPGCQTPGRATLAELAAVWERVVSGALYPQFRETFLNNLAGKRQAAAEGSDYEHIWDTDVLRMIREEAPAGTTLAQMDQFQSSMDVGYKSGAVSSCRVTPCTEVLEDLSIAGWAKVPYCSGGLTASREFVFGLFISGALDTSWTPGKLTAAVQNFRAGRAELLREQIRDGLASCYGTDAVLVSPVSGTILGGRTVVFRWSTAGNATGFRLDVGTAAGGTDLGTFFTTSTSAVVTNLPCGTHSIFARLWTRSDVVYANPKDYVFRACAAGGPLITSPAPASQLTSPTITFTWNAVAAADLYRLSVGSALAGNDIGIATPATNSATITNIPTDGRVVFARIEAHTEAGWGSPSDFAYNNVVGQVPLIASVLNAATLRPNLSPSCLAVINASGFASDVSVSVNNTRAQLVGTPTATQIAFIIPSGVGTGARNVVIASGGATSVAFPVTLSESSPGVFTPLLQENGTPVAAARTFKPGDTVIARAVGLGPFSAEGRPLLSVRATVGGVGATVVSASPVVSSPGVVNLTLRVPGGIPSGVQSLVVQAGAASSPAVNVTIAGPAVAAVLNGASFATGARVAPGSLVAVFGSDLATEDRLGMYPTILLPGSGVITINGVSAPLFDVVTTAGQINLLVPYEAPTTGSVPVVVTNPLGTSTAFQLGMAPAAPGIFRIPDPSRTGRANAAALFANTAWRVGPSSMAAAYGWAQDCKANRVAPGVLCGEPAAAGDSIQIYVTGLGRATANGNPVGNTLRTGDVAPAAGDPLYRTVETPRVTIGGVEAQVIFSGIAPGFAGLYQINVTVPPGVAPGDDVPVAVTIGGASDTATIAIRQP